MSATAVAVLPSAHAPAYAHGFADQRFYPATIYTDSPLAADEMSSPIVTFNPKGKDGSCEIDVGIDIAKRITPRGLARSIEGGRPQ